MARRNAHLALAILAALTLASCSDSTESAEPTPTPVETETEVPTPKGPIVVGSANFVESKLIAETYALALADAGLKVERDYGIGARELYLSEMAAGNVDIVPEYIGSLTENLNRSAFGEDATEKATGDVDATMAELEKLLEPFGAVTTDPSKAQSQNAFAVRADYAEKHKLTTISDLKKLNGKMVGGGPKTCGDNPKCLIGLEEVYGLEFKDLVKLDTGGSKTFDALENGKIDVGLVFSADGTVDKRGFVVLEDDKELQVAENITALMTGENASDEILAPLDKVNAALSTKALRKMNRQVKHGGLPVKYVAAKWAADEGLVPEDVVPPKPTPTPVPEPDPEVPAEPEPAPAAPASWRNVGEPSANAQSRNWAALAQCESGGNPSIISGNGLYHGLYQFSIPTWQSVGGYGAPSNASAEEQTYRAQILYDRTGPGSWPVCGANL